jgi:hypothetical protein
MDDYAEDFDEPNPNSGPIPPPMVVGWKLEHVNKSLTTKCQGTRQVFLALI